MSSNMVMTHAFSSLSFFYSGFGWLLTLALYVIGALANQAMFRKAGVPYAWLAWIPIASLWPFMWTIKKSPWNILWLFVPIVGDIMAIIWMVRLFKAFRQSPWWLLVLLLVFIPFVGGIIADVILFIIMLMMAFSQNVQYDPYFDQK